MLEIDPRRSGDSLICFHTRKNCQPIDFLNAPNVILIHGFMANSVYLSSMAENFEGNGFTVFLFNYNSYKGIANAAHSLLEKLARFDSLTDGYISKERVTLVGHSMGGLVARSALALGDEYDVISSMITLGTPHSGTLTNFDLLKYFVRAGEHITEAMPGFGLECASAKELIGTDSDAVPLVEILNQNSDIQESTPILSISGGKNWMEFGKSFSANTIANALIQLEMAGQVNDGLVPEASSDLKNLLGPKFTEIEHFNNYSEFKTTNHTYLVENQAIALEAIIWLKKALNA